MTDTTLAALMTEALTDDLATLQADNDPNVFFSATAIARLWTAVADDRDAMSLHRGPENLGDLAVHPERTREGADNDDRAVLKVGPLRYTLVRENGEITRLCSEAGCKGRRVGSQSIYTPFCIDHFDRGRVASLEGEIEMRESALAGERRRLAYFRDGAQR